MSLISIVLVIIVVGVLLWLVNEFIPMQAQVKKILNAVVIIALVLWLLSLLLGVNWGHIGDIRIGKG